MMVDRRYLNINRMKDFRDYLDGEIKGREMNDFVKPMFGEESLDYTQGFVWGELQAYRKVLKRWVELTEVR